MSSGTTRTRSSPTATPAAAARCSSWHPCPPGTSSNSARPTDVGRSLSRGKRPVSPVCPPPQSCRTSEAVMCRARHVGRGVEALSTKRPGPHDARVLRSRARGGVERIGWSVVRLCQDVHLERAGIAGDRLGLLDERASEASPLRLLGHAHLVQEDGGPTIDPRHHVREEEPFVLARDENDVPWIREEVLRGLHRRHMLLEASIELAELAAVASRESANHAVGSEKPSRPRSSAARLSSMRLIDPIGTISSSGTSSSAWGRSVTKP